VGATERVLDRAGSESGDTAAYDRA
jgi:hypothetical protein